MSWFRNLSDTYDRLSDIIGIPDNDGNILLPPYHWSVNTHICVTIDGDGNFRNAEAIKQNIPIPCTEDSSSRSGKSTFPHPLHDQIGFLALDENKRFAYLAQLEKWSAHHPKVNAVFKYVSHNTLISDLRMSDIKTDDPKLFVCFSVEYSPDDRTPHLWMDNTVAAAWHEFCETSQTKDFSLCYVTGNTEAIRSKHPKGINPSVNGAKLISCNDESNYTYKGRFMKSWQANAVSVKASHQAHAMLKYLIATQGYKCDTQAIIAWAVDDGHPAIAPFNSSIGIIDSLGAYEDTVVTVQTGTDKLIAAQGIVERDYAKTLCNTLIGYDNTARLRDNNRHIAVIAVDAATTGRMSVTYYQDMPEKDYIIRITEWHLSCRWHFRNKEASYVSAPGVDRIIAAVFGEPKGESYYKIKKQARERLLHSILNGERIDKGWVNAAVQRVSNPFSFDKQDGGWDIYRWEAAVGVTCAISRKHYLDMKEELSLELETRYTNRDYLYGRLLALADRLESRARYLQTGKNDTDKRATNAVRYMSAFAAKPFRTWRLIYDQLSPYVQRLNGAEWYQRQIDEVMSLFPEGEFENDKPLNGKYLMGYSLQRRALYIKIDEEETENAEQKN